MTQRSRPTRPLQSSLILPRTPKPLSSSTLFHPTPQSLLHSSHHAYNPTNFLKKFLNPNFPTPKSQTLLPHPQKDNQASKQRNNDYVKKIMFDNQELSKKVRQVSKSNKILEEENKKLVGNYCGLRERYVKLKERYGDLVQEYGIEEEEEEKFGNGWGEEEIQREITYKSSANKKNKQIQRQKSQQKQLQSDVQSNVFAYIFKGHSTESQQARFSSKGSLQKDFPFPISLPAHIPVSTITQLQPPPIAGLNRRATNFTFKKSYSITMVNMGIQTEEENGEEVMLNRIQEMYLQRREEESEWEEERQRQRERENKRQEERTRQRQHYHESDKLISPSSRQTELLMKISQYETIMKELERKNGEILGKYQRIKSIIGGQTKGI